MMLQPNITSSEVGLVYETTVVFIAHKHACLDTLYHWKVTKARPPLYF